MSAELMLTGTIFGCAALITFAWWVGEQVRDFVRSNTARDDDELEEPAKPKEPEETIEEIVRRVAA